MRVKINEISGEKIILFFYSIRNKLIISQKDHYIPMSPEEIET
jgi:hypothetical protein